MKKIIAFSLIAIGFSFTANAQKKVVAPSATVAQTPTAPTKASEEAATKDVATLSKVVTLTEAEKKTYFGLFEYKHRALSVNPSEEAKKSIYNSIEMKLRAGLSPAQMAKLDANKKTLHTLTH
ncbi:hypothetical protein GR160_11230 [Flavobacterium sp. Sd200]|uniref:hypothetical protein n=1 Tax=Flavobacterium sp. Sd200 TaxID=2692211 RepID=UPI00136BCCB9|nr:hypothetical protein [Flavobacterium sp. Sd200]MXN91798.1 hypothetical protein [Flavobacterium sp. Sd200]